MTTDTWARWRPPPLAIAAVAIVLLVVALPVVAGIVTERRWFGSVGFVGVYDTILLTKLGQGFGTGLLVFAALFATLRVAVAASKGLRGFVLGDPRGGPRLDLGRVAFRGALAIASVIALLTGLAAADEWETWLRWRHAGTFGVADPIFGRDVGFFVFELPLLSAVASLALWTLGAALVLTALLYAARGGIRFTGRVIPTAERRVRAHLTTLGVLILLVLGFDAWLSMYEVLLAPGDPIAGARYADVHARIPALRVEVAAAVVGAVLLAVSITRKRLAFVGVALGLFVVVDVVGVRVWPSLLHRFSVVPNELAEEAPFIAHNIAATRRAYQLDRITQRELSGELGLGRAQIEANRETIENIRLWDHQPLLDAFAQIQEIRTYYEFVAVDNDRYVIDGQLRQTMLSARELASDSLPNRNWINEHFAFTHGYGVTLGPVNEATPEGLPVLLVQDIPPAASRPELHVSRPAIYFGELANEYAFVKTRNRELDYAASGENVYSEYRGVDGIEVGSGLERLLLAIRLGSMKLLLSDDLEVDSRVLLHREITDRVRQLAPFLRLDRDPYLVIRADGTLTWILDAYTETARYPYSQPTSRTSNYIRNSVKVTIDAYHGTTTFWIADDDDPLLRTWQRIFPGMFHALGTMPADLRAHLRYPEDIFSVQTHVFAVYHLDRPEDLYNREDQWEVPAVGQGDARDRTMGPYYTVMRLPGEEDAEFILMLPFTPKRKDNLAAWLVARSDGEHLGELVAYRFPKDRLVYGPRQVMNRINQDAEISRQVSLWNQRGSQAIFGTLLVIPIEESLIYVCPLYLRSESAGRIPELKRVIVVHENRIAMEPTLDAAIERVFGGEPVAAADTASDTATDTATDAATAADTVTGTDPAAAAATGTDPADALRHYEAAISAQRAGDWARYGQELRRLEETLRRMQGTRAP